MIGVHEAAQRLGVSDARVRAMLKTGHLEGTKIGRAWAVSEQSIAQRLKNGAYPGRPPKSPSPLDNESLFPLPDIETAHRIYDEAAATLPGCYHVAFLQQARSPEEKAFWIHVADFFLQQKQRELVEKGVY